MKFAALLPLVFVGFIAGCDGQAAGQAGEACNTDADCAEGLECHEHDGEMECEVHDEEEEEEEAEESEEAAM